MPGPPLDDAGKKLNYEIPVGLSKDPKMFTNN
jgi:hypothetical protein